MPEQRGSVLNMMWIPIPQGRKEVFVWSMSSTPREEFGLEVSGHLYIYYVMYLLQNSGHVESQEDLGRSKEHKALDPQRQTKRASKRIPPPVRTTTDPLLGPSKRKQWSSCGWDCAGGDVWKGVLSWRREVRQTRLRHTRAFHHSHYTGDMIAWH